MASVSEVHAVIAAAYDAAGKPVSAAVFADECPVEGRVLESLTPDALDELHAACVAAAGLDAAGRARAITAALNTAAGELGIATTANDAHEVVDGAAAFRGGVLQTARDQVAERAAATCAECRGAAARKEDERGATGVLELLQRKEPTSLSLEQAQRNYDTAAAEAAQATHQEAAFAKIKADAVAAKDVVLQAANKTTAIASGAADTVAAAKHTAKAAEDAVEEREAELDRAAATEATARLAAEKAESSATEAKQEALQADQRETELWVRQQMQTEQAEARTQLCKEDAEAAFGAAEQELRDAMTADAAATETKRRLEGDLETAEAAYVDAVGADPTLQPPLQEDQELVTKLRRQLQQMEARCKVMSRKEAAERGPFGGFTRHSEAFDFELKLVETRHELQRALETLDLKARSALQRAATVKDAVIRRHDDSRAQSAEAKRTYTAAKCERQRALLAKNSATREHERAALRRAHRRLRLAGHGVCLLPPLLRTRRRHLGRLVLPALARERRRRVARLVVGGGLRRPGLGTCPYDTDTPPTTAWPPSPRSTRSTVSRPVATAAAADSSRPARSWPHTKSGR